jgi:hypothetical protein
VSLPNYDRWLTTNHAAEAAEAEWDAYESWCLKLDPPKEPMDNPSDDVAWQEQVEAWNEDQAEAMAEAYADRMEDWMGGDEW